MLTVSQRLTWGTTARYMQSNRVIFKDRLAGESRGWGSSCMLTPSEGSYPGGHWGSFPEPVWSWGRLKLWSPFCDLGGARDRLGCLTARLRGGRHTDRHAGGVHTDATEKEKQIIQNHNTIISMTQIDVHYDTRDEEGWASQQQAS